MDYEITRPAKKDYLIIKVNRDISKPFAEEYTKAATEHGKKNGLTKLLIDVRGRSSLSGTLGKYTFAYEDGKKVGLTSDWRVVVLRDKDKTEMDFLETVMQNAGYNYRVLASEEQAIEWLERT
jgi:hypothetical protein